MARIGLIDRNRATLVIDFAPTYQSDDFVLIGKRRRRESLD